MYTLLLGTLLLQPAPEPPSDAIKGVPPLLVKAKVAKDELVSIATITKTVYKAEIRTRIMDGKAVPYTVEVPVTVQSTILRAWDLKKAKIASAGGKKIDLDTLRKRLAVETPVFVSADGKPIDKGYLKLLREDVIVIEAPLIAPPATPVAPPPAPPK